MELGANGGEHTFLRHLRAEKRNRGGRGVGNGDFF